MKKTILNLEGAQILSKNEQKMVVGAKVEPIEASFPCYCNNVFKKYCSTVECCTSACGL
ncbi:hypothetical protein [Flavobacterium sp. J27]|uniref:hypothetical protein n=1 Tax=Flavobacterium sp. J27 TaxID=2060419 RepID=UPI0013EECF47|nr:hypothetical protein [Flavobacterium sp. J27]